MFITILTDNDGADFPKVEPRIRTKLEDEEAAAASTIPTKYTCLELKLINPK